MKNTLGCNTLYPHGRLSDCKAQFTIEAQKLALRNIGDAGFDGCEFSHYEWLDVAQCEVLRAECGRLGLGPWSAHSWVALAGELATVAERTAQLRRSIEGAAALGVGVMVVHPPSYPRDATAAVARTVWEQAVEATLRALVPALAAANVSMAIENCGPRTDLEALVGLLARLDLPGIGLNIDTGHAQIHGMQPAEAIRLMGKRLLTTHLQDNFGKNDDHLPPGCGTIDWPATLDALREVQYQRMLMVEISDCPSGREPDAVADTRRAFENLSRFVQGQV
jgi:sugar phosphate isomerase/epimerase